MSVKEEEEIYRAAQMQLDEYVLQHKMRHSQVRDMVLEQICALPQPFTAAQLEEVCEAERISKGTVYNVLHLLIKLALVRVYVRGVGQTVTEYELVTEASRSHMQVICRKCGRRAFFYDKAIQRMVEERQYSNFNLHNYTLVVYGECKICRRLVVARKK